MAGMLTTHVLDTMHGRPAAALQIQLWRLLPGTRELLKSVRTVSSGRTDAPLLQDETFSIGSYELVFSIGDYYRHLGIDLPEPAFLDEVPVRFHIADPEAHYHVPLLVSPWAYSTYRGS